MGHHQGRHIHLCDDRGHGEGLARAGGPQQHLVLLVVPDALEQLADGFRLVAGGLEGGLELEVHGSG